MSCLLHIHNATGTHQEQRGAGDPASAVEGEQDAGSAQEVLDMPGSLLQLPAPADMELPPTDYAAWFGMRLALIFTLISQWRECARTCHDLQAILNKEIIMFDAIKPPSVREEYSISRRQAIIAIASLPLALLMAVQQGHWSALVKDEFLSRCAASITACWHLMAGREFAEVEHALSTYLPLLQTWATQPSAQQKTAADLAAQGALLMGLVSLHTARFPKNLHGRVAYCKQAVQYAKISGDRHLLSATLTRLAASLRDTGHPADMLQKSQEAAQYLNEVSPLLQSKLYGVLANAYARNGQAEEALRCLGLARETLPADNVFVPIFLSGDSGLFYLILMEGETSLVLGDQHPDSHHYEQAGKVLAQIETLPSTIIVPERIRIEIINKQALAAMKAGKLERFGDYLERGIRGANTLGSEKRRREAAETYLEAQKVWPNEPQMKELADLIISMN
jgi:tetratricopeptide (TPR) repeat protein